jgi:hypothetical protein
MRPGDDCNFCRALLDAHCAVNGEPFCSLKEEYLTTDLSADEMLDKFYSLVTDEQLARADPEVHRRMAELAVPSPTFASRASLSGADPGRAAAERWLENWRNGKDG